MPAWLATYPGADAEVRDRGALLESTYRTPGKVADVVEHYRRLFESAGLVFQPNANGAGYSIRAAASECDLLILILENSSGSSVVVNCAAKTAAGSSSAAPAIITGSTSGTGHAHAVREAGIRVPRGSPGAEDHDSRGDHSCRHGQFSGTPDCRTSVDATPTGV